MGRIFVDSNIFIFAEIGQFKEHVMAVSKLNALSRRDLFVMNTIIASEVHYKLGRLLGWVEAERRTENILRSPFIIYEAIFRDTVSSALSLATRKNIKTNDAIIAQHCLDLGVGEILTDNVRDLKKVKGLEVIDLRSSLRYGDSRRAH